jgi:hypothetical protein
MTDNHNLDETDTPTIFGLWQLIPSDKPPSPPTESSFVKNIATVLNTISYPIIRLFYGDKIVLSYGRFQQLRIFLLILIIPTLLFFINYFYISKHIPSSKKMKLRTDKLRDRTMIYMICIWISMFALFVLLFPRLQNISE